MLNFAVVEDEDGAAETLARYIKRYCDAKSLTASVTRYNDATLLLKNYKPYDVIFMDILLPNLNGMDASKQLRKIDEEVILIFVTNMSNFAVKGYEVSALDFIIKPVVYDSFIMRMDKAVKAAYNRKSFDIELRMDGAIKLISAAKLFYAESNRHYLIYHTEEGNFRARGTIGDLEKTLAGENFSRCNICYLVNLKYVNEINGENLTVAGDTLKISRTRKKEFMHAFANYLGRGV